MMYHIDDEGNPRPCHARVRACPRGLHGATQEEVRALYEEERGGSFTPAKPLKQGRKRPPVSWREGGYHGLMAPRSIQVEALHSVAEALEEEPATQLVAACGTGKTYMHRQLMEHFLTQEESNGVGIMLTSSIKLAQDTAQDLRPQGGYDEALGTYGEDYEIIEVHSGVRKQGERATVLEKGVVSVERIYHQWQEAQAAGKKVVIISTYDSVAKVQEAQALFQRQETVRADLLIHDEAHNILGQQRPTQVAGQENELTAYVGFHDSIPGALQSKRRLYSTATPVVQETEADKAPTGGLEEARAAALRMKAGDQKERVTVYSDDPLVGGVSGFIPQERAVAEGYLAKPSYNLRETQVRGRIQDFKDPVVTPQGFLQERTHPQDKRALSPETYGALTATLEALAADHEEGVNPPTNALAYVGSIEQAEGFKEAFREVALAKSGGLTVEEAEGLIHSPQEGKRLQARYRLLAEHGEVRAAHSRTDGASVREKQAAFTMFQGKAVVEGPWTPHKRVLANVDIFSEGVSIPEIDTVVISDDSKLNERALTQAVGRSLRTVGGNKYKQVGHVIIPSVQDEGGHRITEGSEAMAAYAVTRVERAVTPSLLRGEGLPADATTSFTFHRLQGGKEEVLARDMSRKAVTDLRDLAVASEMESNHLYLMANDPNHRERSPQERFQVQKTLAQEKLANVKGSRSRRAYLREVTAHLEGKTSREVQAMARRGRVLSAALAIGDVGSISPQVFTHLVEAGVVKPKEAGQQGGITLEEKRAFLRQFSEEAAYALITSPPKGQENPHHLRAQALLPREVVQGKEYKSGAAMQYILRGAGAPPALGRLTGVFQEHLQDETFVEEAYLMVTTTEAPQPPILRNCRRRELLLEAQEEHLEKRRAAEQAAAEEGQVAYEVEATAVRKTGELRANSLQRLLGGSE